MAEKHLIVFGDQADQQIRKNLNRIKSYKEAEWLYDGILYQDETQSFDIIEVVFKDKKFAPDALIDNGKWISPALFGNNQDIWREAIRQCFSLVRRGNIHCYTYLD